MQSVFRFVASQASAWCVALTNDAARQPRSCVDRAIGIFCIAVRLMAAWSPVMVHTCARAHIGGLVCVGETPFR
jgi:hypothetical protein